MKNKKIPEQNREENYFVKASLIVKDMEIKDVPCKIYLPERPHELPYLVFKPSEEHSLEIMTSHKGSFKAVIYGYDKKIQTTIEAPEVYFSGSSKKDWGEDFVETTIPGEPQDLHVIRHLSSDDSQEKTHIVFWLSPNKLLTPFMTCTTSYTGEINYKRISNLEFEIRDDFKIVFDKHFSSKTTRNRELIQWSFLVACTDLDIPADDANALKTNILPEVDDFLLIASFATRERTACLGWSATDNNSHATFYRGNFTFPEGNNDNNIDDGVIDFKYFGKFMQDCYSTFLKFENKLAIRSAIYSIVPSSNRTVEASFLRIFSGLETLILDFRRKGALEFILSEKEWQALRKYLQTCIKKSTYPKLSCEQRSLIYPKLGELNRVSLREAFDLFCQKYEVDLNDLWPVFGNKEVAGLVEIRNRLIHGDPFPHDLDRPLIVAEQHLKYTIERIILGVLRWNVMETNVRPDYLAKHFLAIKNLPDELKRFSEYLQVHE